MGCCVGGERPTPRTRVWGVDDTFIRGPPGGTNARRALCVVVSPETTTAGRAAARPSRRVEGDQQARPKGPAQPPRTKDQAAFARNAAKVQGRRASSVARDGRAQTACNKRRPVVRCESRVPRDSVCVPWSTAVRRRLGSRGLDASCYRLFVRGYSSCWVSAAAGRKGGRSPFLAPTRWSDGRVLLIS